ncbi:MAG: ATP-dependent Clp protease ATP-binding subunit, partial [Proteobacteria bacterium]|nr:ATP-dependent Clp protease ATP-binding subunit [Pseudomonadota bacterium]
NHLTKDLTDEEISYIVTVTNRYAPQEAQPRKSEKVMNMAAASAEFEHRSEINRNDILAAVAQMSNLPLDFLNQSDHERFLKLETDLPNEVLGQPGLSKVVDGLIGARSGLTDENQPWGCFVMQGPTGTGKTEACKALARHLFGSEDALIKLDMSEYSEKFSVARLIGAPPGYVGFEDTAPALTERVSRRPYCILLLDEIEKAHPDVFNTLLPILNDGAMTDNHGKKVLFNNVIVVMTTNAGATNAMKFITNGGNEGGMDFSSTTKAELSPEQMMEKLAKIYSKAVTTPTGDGRPALFRPEMINRIEELGGFITFIPLVQQVISNLVGREIEKVGKRLTRQDRANIQGVTLEVTPDVAGQLAKEGYDPAMGARPLRGVVRRKIQNPLGKWLMANKEKVLAFVAEHGAAKLLVNSLSNFEPKLEKVEAAVETKVSNDNVVTLPKKVKASKVKAPKL